MLHTLIYKFKKRELTDTPPDITATNSNWDIVERELNQLRQEMNTTFKVSNWLPIGTHVDTLWSTGYYTCGGFEGLPSGQADKQGTIITCNYNGSPHSFWSRQIFISPHFETMYERNAVAGEWSEWRQL